MTDRRDGPPFEQPPDFPPMRVGYGGHIRVRNPDTGKAEDIDLGWTTEEVRLDDPELRRVLPDGSTVPARLDREDPMPRPPDLRQAQFENVAIRAHRIVKTADGSPPDHKTLIMMHEQGPWLEPDERELIVQLLDAAIRSGGETSRRAAALRKKLSAG